MIKKFEINVNKDKMKNDKVFLWEIWLKKEATHQSLLYFSNLNTFPLWDDPYFHY